MNQGEAILAVIEAVADNPSKKEKQRLLTEGLQNPDFGETMKAMLFWCYSRTHRYGIKYVDPKPSGYGNVDITDESFWKLLADLSDRSLTGNAAREAVDRMVARCDPASANLLRRIIHKDMRAGFTEGTLNKIIPKWIKEPPYMRCSLPDKSNIDKWKWEEGIYIQLKADGMYQSATRSGDAIVLESRSGEILPEEAFPELRAALLVAMPDQMMWCGELTVVDAEGNTLKRADGNGMINSVRQGGTLPAGHEIRYSCWDAIDTGLDASGGDKANYDTRWMLLESCMMGSAASKYLGLIESYVVHSKAEAIEIVRKWMEMGLEGGVAKSGEGAFKDGTSKDQVKLKLSAQIEVRIKGFQEGAKGKKTEKTFGALIYETDDGKIKGTVSGMDDKTRADMHANRERFMDLVMTLEANDITRSRDNDFWALSHPRVIEVRTDKTTTDTLESAQDIFNNARSNFLD
ncbi:DNA ligase [Acidovorax phage ACP17]|uniref:DNA ligase n=1 Tax=Acidovorax phage ACP17 TaxID=2010329 RepID=A0A218M3C8_9CAUD|nr:DNA ligase [Acidovorax phage ACP17]ASD50539.1 DNA ligase [Acidovorax phage ACP17]